METISTGGQFPWQARQAEEAFARANNIPCGLSAGGWTDKGSKIFKMVNKLRVGVIGEHLQQFRPGESVRWL